MVAPRPEKIFLTQDDLDFLAKTAEERDRRRGYSTRRDLWGQGFVASPTLVGLVGEFATAQYLTEGLGATVPINTDDAPAGDGGFDLVKFGARIEIKTRRWRGESLLRRETEAGRLVPINWDIFVSATWEREAAPLVPTLDGWIFRRDFVEASGLVLGRAGPWNNLELTDVCLDPMPRLIEALEVCRDYRRIS